MKTNKVKVGVIGCGNICDIYFTNCTRLFRILDVVACSDIVMEKAKKKAAEYKIPRACRVKQLLADPEIQIVLNLTIPKAHAEVALAALKAGKSVYGEKPFAITRHDGQKMLKAAKSKKLRLGSAPDTFMGAGIQTCIKLIDDGAIGKPVAATAFVMCRGHESWHPNPEFYYKRGGGPMFDLGPYYLTTLIAMLGPVRRVTASDKITFPKRLITSAPKKGTMIKVEVPTHVAGILDFSNGAIGTIVTSFDVWHAKVPRIEIYGTEGSLSVPDPNGFAGPVKIRKAGAKEWSTVSCTHGYKENSRGIGLADMAYALQSGRPNRASGEMAFHVLDIMQALHEASVKGRHIELKSSCARPAPLPTGLRHGLLDK